jgi:hypothetical protein
MVCVHWFPMMNVMLTCSSKCALLEDRWQEWKARVDYRRFKHCCSLLSRCSGLRTHARSSVPSLPGGYGPFKQSNSHFCRRMLSYACFRLFRRFSLQDSSWVTKMLKNTSTAFRVKGSSRKPCDYFVNASGAWFKLRKNLMTDFDINNIIS